MDNQKLKKFLPVGILLIAVLVVVGIVIAVRGGGDNTPVDEDEQVADVAFQQRPAVVLVPRADGHWLDLTIMGMDKVQGASTMEYLFLYTTANGAEQGSSGGPYDLSSEDMVEEELLLGTTSSGNFYYDEGVEAGELTLRYRNDDGKLVGKVTVPWVRREGAEMVEIEGWSFTPEEAEDIYVLAMHGFGLPSDVTGTLASGPVGFFSSDEDTQGTVTAPSGIVYAWNESEWTMVEVDSAVTSGIFVSTN